LKTYQDYIAKVLSNKIKIKSDKLVETYLKSKESLLKISTNKLDVMRLEAVFNKTHPNPGFLIDSILAPESIAKELLLNWLKIKNA
jgi:hypothetical protein